MFSNQSFRIPNNLQKLYISSTIISFVSLRVNYYRYTDVLCLEGAKVQDRTYSRYKHRVQAGTGQRPCILAGAQLGNFEGGGGQVYL